MAGYPACTCTVQVCVSGVIQSNIEEAWSAVKAWGDAAWMGPAVLLDGSEQTIGALRRVNWGRGRVVERLTGYDVNSHTQKSRLISHPENVNPFSASFLNYVTALKLTEVTIDSSTFVELQGSFETDQMEADAMHDSVNASYEARIRSLQALLCAGAAEAPVQRGALASPHSCGWHSTGSVASVGSIAEQQAVAAAVQAAAATAAAAEALAAQRAAFAQQAAQLEAQRRALDAQAAAQAEREAEAAAAAAHAQQQQQHAQQQQQHAALAAAYGDASPTASQAYHAAQQQAAAAFAALAVSQAPGAAAAAQTYEHLAATEAARQAALLALASSQAMLGRPGAYAALAASGAYAAAPAYAAPAAPASPGPVKPAQAAQPPSPAGPGFAPGLPGGFVPGRPEPSNDSSGGASFSPRKTRSEHGRAY